MTDLTTVGDRIRFARSQKRFSQEELASLLGLNNSVQISNWERNVYKPNAERLQAIADALSTTTAWLLKGIGNQPIDNVSRGTVPSAEERDHIVSRVNQAAHRLKIRRAQEASEMEIEGLRRELSTALDNGLLAGSRDPQLRAWLVAEFLAFFDRPEIVPGVQKRPVAGSDAEEA